MAHLDFQIPKELPAAFIKQARDLISWNSTMTKDGNTYFYCDYNDFDTTAMVNAFIEKASALLGVNFTKFAYPDPAKVSSEDYFIMFQSVALKYMNEALSVAMQIMNFADCGRIRSV